LTYLIEDSIMRTSLRTHLPRFVTALFVPALAAGLAAVHGAGPVPSLVPIASAGPPPCGADAPTTNRCHCNASLKKVGPLSVVAGQPARYQIFVSYSGHESCSGGALCVEDALPAGLTCDPRNPAFASQKPATPERSTVNAGWGCTCTEGARVRCCLLGELPREAKALPAIVVPVNVAAKTRAVSKIENCATIAQGFAKSFADSNASDDRSCVTATATATAAPTVVPTTRPK
jgi:hypothetical protein